jgi:hypothetical protein
MLVLIFDFSAEQHDALLWLGRDCREKVLVVAPPRHPDGNPKIGEPPLWRRSHVDSVEIHWGSSLAPSPRCPSIVSARKAAPVIHAERLMYGAGLTGGNADQVL